VWVQEDYRMARRYWTLAKALLLGAGILIRYDTMEVVVYVEPGTDVVVPAEFVARQACNVLHAMDLALPTPYRLQWRKQLPNGAVLPDDSRVVTGMLTEAGCAGV
jgi:hypothetical protein